MYISERRNNMTIKYLWSKFIKKIPLAAIKDSSFEKPSKIEARSSVINTSMGRYSYCGYNCLFINCSIGRFCSIADNVVIGLAEHPLDWVSTSCAFYFGKDSIPKNLASLDYNSMPKKTFIGNDVWIGQGAYIKSGLTIGTGSVVGMGSVVTKDVPPYAIVAGVPAKIVGMRFEEDIVNRLIDSEWWNMSDDELRKYSKYFNDVKSFLSEVKKKR